MRSPDGNQHDRNAHVRDIDDSIVPTATRPVGNRLIELEFVETYEFSEHVRSPRIHAPLIGHADRRSDQRLCAESDIANRNDVRWHVWSSRKVVFWNWLGASTKVIGRFANTGSALR